MPFFFVGRIIHGSKCLSQSRRDYFLGGGDFLEPKNFLARQLVRVLAILTIGFWDCSKTHAVRMYRTCENSAGKKKIADILRVEGP